MLIVEQPFVVAAELPEVVDRQLALDSLFDHNLAKVLGVKHDIFLRVLPTEVLLQQLQLALAPLKSQAV